MTLLFGQTAGPIGRGRGAPRLAAASLAAILLVGTGAWADDRQTMTLIDLSAEGSPEREISHDIGRALKADDKVRYRDPDESLNVGAEDADVTNIRSGRSFLRAGRKSLEAKDWAQAAEDLEGAVTSYLSSYAHAAEEDPIEEALLLHGVALLKAGQKERAAKAFVRGVEFRPRFEMDLSSYGADVVTAYKAAREAVALRPDVTFEVRSSVPNAEVWVNGRYFGLAPAFVKSSAGPQYIRTSKHGFARAGRMMQIKDNDSVVPFELVPARRKAAWDALRGRLAEVFEGAVEANDLSAAQGLLNANMAVIVHCSGTREKMTVQVALANLAGRQVLKRIKREMSWLRRDKAVIDSMMQELFVAPDMPMGSEGPTVRTESVLKKWWFWTLIGGVVAGSVTAAVLLGDSEPAPPKYAPGTGGLVLKF